MPERVGERAVIADCWPMVRVGMTTVLGALGIRVVAQTDDAAGVLSALRQQPAEVVLLGDVGTSTADLIRKLTSGDRPPACIALLGAVSVEELKAILATPVAAVVPRGVGPDELRSVVEQALAGERIVSPSLLPLLFGTDVADAEQSGPLTPKEREVMRLVAAGRSNGEIAETLYVSGATVKTHLAHIYSKLDVRSRHEALARAASLGLLG